MGDGAWMWFYVVLTIALWGTLPVVQVFYSRSMSLAMISAIFFAVCITLAPVVCLTHGGAILAEGRALMAGGAIVWAALAGVAITIASTMTYLRALQLSGSNASVVVTVTCAYPILTALLMSALFNDAITPRVWLGIGLIVAGCVAVAKP